MKLVVSYILLLSLTFHMFLSTGYVVDYYLQMESYMARCVNKNKPITQCNGKCLLAKKIEAAQQTQSSQPGGVTFTMSFEYLSNPFAFVVLENENLPDHQTMYARAYHYSWHPDLNKPPILG